MNLDLLERMLQDTRPLTRRAGDIFHQWIVGLDRVPTDEEVSTEWNRAVEKAKNGRKS